MLFRTILFDSAIQPVPAREELIYNSLYRLLKDVYKYGVILVDDEGEILKSFKSILKEWNELSNFPEGSQAGRDLFRLFEAISKNNRFIEVSAQKTEILCDSITCERQISIAHHHEPDFLLSGQRCLTCLGKNLTSLKTALAIAVDSYDRNEEFQRFTSMRGFEISAGLWCQSDFENKVLIPLFRVTDTVKLFDKQMGEYFDSNSGYGNTLEWCLKVFSEYSISTPERRFEMYVGSVRSLDARKRIREFEREVKKFYSDKFDFEVVWGSHHSHDRFLETNQVRVFVGRGFDLIQDSFGSYPRRLKDITVGYIDEVSF